MRESASSFVKINKNVFLLLIVFLLVPKIIASEKSNCLLPVQEFHRDDKSYNNFTIDMNKYIQGITEKEFKLKLIKNGFVVLLNAIPSPDIDNMRSLLDQTYEKAQNDHSLNDDERRNISNSHITENVFRKYNPGNSLFNVFNNKLKNLGNYFFSCDFRFNEGTHTRRVKPLQLSDLKYFQFPMGIHIDAMYHNPREFVLNFWTPLDDCGKDKPTLRTFVSNVDDTFALMQFDIRTLTFNALTYKQVEEGTASFLQELPSYYFVVNKGDIVVISNWTFHSGYANENMQYPRWSMELRISGNKFWYTK